MTSAESGSVLQAVAFVSASGELRLVAENGEQVVGKMSANESSYTADVVLYSPTGTVLLQSAVSGAATGQFREGGTLTGSLNAEGKLWSTFSLSYDVIYELGSSLSLMAGIYSESNGTGYTRTFAIDSQGNLTGSDTNGCQFNGPVSLIDPAFNLYWIDVTVTNCGILSDDYSGLASLLDNGETKNDTLAVSISGTKYAVSGAVPRI